jgi:hypothetical protein
LLWDKKKIINKLKAFRRHGVILYILSTQTPITHHGEHPAIKLSDSFIISMAEKLSFIFPQLLFLDKFKTITFSWPNQFGTCMHLLESLVGILQNLL